MNRKGLLALVAILVFAIVGAYASSLMSTGRFKLSAVETVGSFIIRADEIVISGGPPSLLLSIASASDDTPIAFAIQVDVVITNLNLTKVDGDRTLEILATSATGYMLEMNMTSLSADSAEFENLTIVDIPEFEQSAGGSVTMTGVEIHAVYMFAELQTLYGMELNVKESD